MAENRSRDPQPGLARDHPPTPAANWGRGSRVTAPRTLSQDWRGATHHPQQRTPARNGRELSLSECLFFLRLQRFCNAGTWAGPDKLQPQIAIPSPRSAPMPAAHSTATSRLCDPELTVRNINQPLVKLGRTGSFESRSTATPTFPAAVTFSTGCLQQLSNYQTTARCRGSLSLQKVFATLLASQKEFMMDMTARKRLQQAQSPMVQAKQILS